MIKGGHMLEIKEGFLENLLERLILKATVEFHPEVLRLLQDAYQRETQAYAKDALKQILEYYPVSKERGIGMCQTPGASHILRVNLGSRVKLSADPAAVFSRIVDRMTRNGLHRPSLVHPLTRQVYEGNVGAHLPMTEYELIPDAEYVEFITFQPTGLALAVPFQAAQCTPGAEFARKAVAQVVATVRMYCPPFFIGVCIGGVADQSLKLAKEACFLRRPIDAPHSDPQIAYLEQKITEEINNLGIGCMNLGGDITALNVNVEVAAAHLVAIIASVWVQCYPLKLAGVRIQGEGRIENI